MDFFEKPKKARRKRGRPKKRKRGAARKKAKNKQKRAQVDQPAAKASPKVGAVLTKSDLTGALALARRKKNTRVNWDLPKNWEHRERVARSWMNNKDLFRQGETYEKFCSRCGISRTTLTRYIKLLEKNGKHVPNKRGRKPMLSESVMRHIAERAYCYVMSCYLCFFIHLAHRVKTFHLLRRSVTRSKR